MTRSKLYQTFMNIRKELGKQNLSDDLGWGAFFPEKNLENEDWLENAGGFIYLPEDAEIDTAQYSENIKILPAGEYLCMNRFDMPYKRKAVDELLEWAKQHDIKTEGNLIDECLLDTTFQGITDTEKVDFSQLQIYIRR